MRIFIGVALIGAMASSGFAFGSVASAEPSWTVPNVVGMDLQGAQDMIQSVTHGAVGYSGSTDLPGRGRAQFSDRNWVVCTSTPPVGHGFTASTKVDFGVVRIDSESCP
jgi:hypothetical protein